MALDWKNVNENTKIRVVFYGRVSTEHEMQLEAFKNQTKWYYDLLERNPNWELPKSIDVETYLDRGITGTQAKIRDGFMKMIGDAERGRFDMIVTRDVSRFGRNTLDTLEYTRKLKAMGIQVYFYNDNIRTLQDKDSEMRLTFLATFAQEESSKISDRVKSGQYSSRRSGVLYGSGNILGYDRIRKVGDGDKRNHLGDTSMPTFAINPEQAETVRRIYDLYEQGYGLRRIKNELLKEKRKNSAGAVSWSERTIGSILDNPMYIGKQRQHNTVVEDFLTGKHKSVPKEERTYAQGDFEPILTVEQFERVQEMRSKKHKENPESPFGKGGRETSDKWVDKLECACGSRYRKYTWAKRKDGTENIGYCCVNRTLNGSLDFRIRKGLIDEKEVERLEQLQEIEGYDIIDEKTGEMILFDPGDICDMKGIPAWYLELMAKKVFTYLTGAHQEEILKTLEGIADGYLKDATGDIVDTDKLRDKIKKQQQKIDRLLDLYSDGNISKEKYLEKCAPINDELDTLKKQLYDAEKGEESEEVKEALDVAMENIRKLADFSTEIAPDFLKRYVDKVVVHSNYCFEWMINVHGDAVKFIEANHKVNSAKLSEKRQFTNELQKSKYNATFTDRVNFDEARKFRKAQGTYLRPSQWDDLLMMIYIRN